MTIKAPGERSGIVLIGGGDGLTTRILDALTGEDLGARYGVRKVTLQISGENWDGASLVLELGCPVMAQLGERSSDGEIKISAADRLAHADVIHRCTTSINPRKPNARTEKREA